eukprot:763172-Hanusia_phi.AAC.2
MKLRSRAILREMLTGANATCEAFRRPDQSLLHFKSDNSIKRQAAEFGNAVTQPLTVIAEIVSEPLVSNILQVIYTENTATFPEASFHREQVLSAIGRTCVCCFPPSCSCRPSKVELHRQSCA